MDSKDNIENKNLLIEMPQSETGLELMVKGAERFLALQDRIRKMAINLTNQNDWIDQNGKPYLEISGANKISAAFGISTKETIPKKEFCNDDRGEYIQFKFIGTLCLGNREISAIGISSTRDDFFCKRRGEILPLSEINLNDVEKKAFTNFLNRGVKSLLGLSYTWDEIEKYSNGKIIRQKVTGVSYSKGFKGGSSETKETKDLRVEIHRMLLEIEGGDEAEAAKLLEMITQWKNSEGKILAGKKDVKDISERALPVAYGKVKANYENFLKANNMIDIPPEQKTA